MRKIFDDAGLLDTKIFASGGLDEYEIARLLADGARLDAFGVGTELGTSGDAPSLDSTYKLVACRDGQDEEVPVIKLSAGKLTLPGHKQAWRYHRAGRFAGDVIGLEDETPSAPSAAPDAALVEPLLQPVMRGGDSCLGHAFAQRAATARPGPARGAAGRGSQAHIARGVPDGDLREAADAGHPAADCARRA